MASFYLDVGVLLGAAGHRATSARDQGNLNASDEVRLAYATERRWMMLTHNMKHFRRLHEAWIATNRSHAGILALDRPRGLTAEDIAARVAELLAAPEVTFVGSFWRWRGNDEWRCYPDDR